MNWDISEGSVYGSQTSVLKGIMALPYRQYCLCILIEGQGEEGWLTCWGKRSQLKDALDSYA